MADIQRICQGQENRKFKDHQPILLRQGPEVFILHGGGSSAVIAHQIGDNILLTQAQTDQPVGIEQIVAMFIVINGINKMSDIMEERANLQQEQVVAVQVVK